MVKINEFAMKQMIEDTEQIFPDECCGFLFGKDTDGVRGIQIALPVLNSKEGDKRRRFYIAPKDYMNAEKYALENGLDLLGVYHSHPNHPAIPSEHDRVAALPFFSYVILSVMDGRYDLLRSWRLNDEQEFIEETIY